MRESFEEFLVVLSYSTKTQLALIFGVVFFVITMVAGDYFYTHMEIQGILSPLSDVIRESILQRYDKVAWIALFGFIVLAAKCYEKDRNRLFGL